MRLDIDDPQVWNKWRALYNELTYEENLAFANAAEAKYPSQQHHTKSNFDNLFAMQKEAVNIIEIGGWKGELASHCLNKFPIINSWANVELCSNAIDKTVISAKTNPKYNIIRPNKFDWFKDPITVPVKHVFDICVSSHTIEHFSDDHLRDLIKYISGIPLVIFEAPIKDEGDDWSLDGGYGGTHILKMGWNGVNEAMFTEKYRPEKINDHCYLYRFSGT